MRPLVKRIILFAVVAGLLFFKVGAALAAPFAYITNESSGTVSVIDITTNTVVATIPVGNNPFGVAVNPAGTRVYVTNGGSNNVSVLDTAANTLIATVAVGNIPQGVAVNPAGTRVYVANGSSNTVSVIDTANNTVIATVTGLFLATGVAINPAGTLVYIAGGGDVYAIDTTSLAVVATLNTGAAPINGIVVNSAGTRLYVAHGGNDDIYVLDAATLAVVNIVDLTNGGPTGVALNPSGTRLYVTKYSGGSVTVIDTTTLAILATIPVGTQPIGVAVNSAGTRAYVAVNFPGSVAVIDTSSNTVVDTVATGLGSAAFGLFIGTPPAATVPGAPTIGPATPGNAQATIAFTAPASNGGSPITGYTVTCGPGAFSANGTASPLTVTGLTNGTTYTCSVTATNAIGTSAPSATVNVMPVVAATAPGAPTISTATPGNGQATISFTPPASNGGSPITGYTATCNPGAFSTSGAASPLTVTGLTNGTTYICSVTATNAIGTGPASATVNVTPLVAPQCYSAPSATGSGSVNACFTGGGATCTYETSRFIAAPPGTLPVPPTTPGPGIVFPHGLFDFLALGCTAGSTLSFTITYPSALAAGTQYWKYGPTPSNATPHWYVLPATIAGNTATFTITDGGMGDDDLLANGEIVDQGGPGGGPGGGAATSVPTLSEWAMVLLALLLLGITAHRYRVVKC